MTPNSILPLCVALLIVAGCATQAGKKRVVVAANLAPMPEAVTSFGATTENGWIYVFGGHKGERHQYCIEEVSGSFHRMDLTQGTPWEPLPSSDPAQGASLLADEQYVYRVGGMAAQNHRGEKADLRSKTTVERYDVVHGKWESLIPLPMARSSHDSALVGSKLYVGGGWTMPGGTNRSVWSDTLLELDVSQTKAEWREIPQPFKRRALAAAALGSKIYFLGGMTSENKPSREVDIYDVRSGKWTKGPELPDGPLKGFGSSAIAQNGRLFWSGKKGDVYCLSSDGNSWKLAGSLQHPRFFHRLVPAGETQLIVAGGEDDEGKRSDLELVTPALTVVALGQATP